MPSVPSSRPIGFVFICFFSLILGTARGTIAAPAAMKDGNWDTLKLTSDKPAGEDTFLGNPIGNGHTGAKIKGGVGTEIIQLNDKWFWSGGPDKTPPDPKRRAAMEQTRKLLAAGDIPGADTAAKGMWGDNDMGTFLPVGNLSIAFDHGDAGATGYSRVLDLDRALSTVQYTTGGVTYTREAFASFPDDVVVLRLSASGPGKIGFSSSIPRTWMATVRRSHRNPAACWS